ncbi:MAG: putative signal transducing protein [Bacteroidales bacterium]
MNRLIEITAFNQVNEAYILRSLLESKGISTYIQDENIAAIYGAGVGGIKVMISSADIKEAKEIMDEHGYLINDDVAALLDDTPQPEKAVHPAPRLEVHVRVISITLIIVLIVLLIVFYMGDFLL